MILALMLLSIAALAFVLHPLFAEEGRETRAVPYAPDVPNEGDEGAIAALREIEFDHATGKLSVSDYTALKARYTRDAVEQLRAGGGAEVSTGPVDTDAVEALISRQRSRLRSCAEHGTRPEPDAIYCSDCGRYLRGACAKCGADAAETGARFCSACGSALAA